LPANKVEAQRLMTELANAGIQQRWVIWFGGCDKGRTAAHAMIALPRITGMLRRSSMIEVTLPMQLQW